MDFNVLTCLPNVSKKKRSHEDSSPNKKLKASVQTCSKVDSLESQKLHRSSKLAKVRRKDKVICSKDNAIEVCEKQKADTAINALNSEISSYSASEKLLPFIKRKSRYHVIEEVDGNAELTNEESSCCVFEDDEFVKMKSLSSIYLTARIVTSNSELL